MQSLTEIRNILAAANLRPNPRLGQCFLIDQNLLSKVVELADIRPDRTVLEVGPGTGTLTEELLERAQRVVAVELDRGLARVLSDRMADRENFRLLWADALAGKTSLNPAMLAAIGDSCDLVANLPYSIATPLIQMCIRQTLQVRRGGSGPEIPRMTFLVQREVGDRFTAAPGSRDFGPVAVWVQLTCRIRQGPVLPPSAFWPRPKIDSRLLRLDFDDNLAGQLSDPDALDRVLKALFAQRRKQIGKLARQDDRRHSRLPSLAGAVEEAGLDTAARAEQLEPRILAELANLLAAG
ncbi:MAG: 16S rRNA (adenine(1518)-N(6)/adenine(1519)-N(6))-dimethyltransferase RsmA [Phycisphaerae bacterium]